MNKFSNSNKIILIIITFIVGLCSIIYELLISTISSYLLGDSIRQFSLIIGIYLASMGLGSFFSRFIHNKLLLSFIYVELILGLIGALSVPMCYMYFSYSDASGYQIFVLFLVFLIGMLTGFEIPILTRIMEDELGLRENISNILTYDYLGALAATLLFPFFLIPLVGLYKSSLIFGLINIAVGLTTIYVFRDFLEVKKSFKNAVNFFAIILCIVIGFMIYKSNDYLNHWENSIYKFPVIYTENSPYQNISITQQPDEFRLYLNGAIQFSSRDEYRYHEALTHIPLQQLDKVEHVLLLGGGEGLAAREILKYEELISLKIIDIDPAVTKVSNKLNLLKDLNQGSLEDAKVEVLHEDAFAFLKQDTKQYDAIIIDLPDPSNESLARLYSSAFYKLCLSRLTSDGIVCTQATSPELSKKAFWCIASTMYHSGFAYTYPYHINIPSFGNWGFIMAKNNPTFIDQLRPEIEYAYLENELLKHIFYFPKDARLTTQEINRLDKPVILEYYLDHWQSLQGQKR